MKFLWITIYHNPLSFRTYDMLNKDQARKKLLSKAAEILGRRYDRAFISEFQDELNVPQFEVYLDSQNWQHHVPTEIQELWHFLDEFARITVWMIANNQIPILKED